MRGAASARTPQMNFMAGAVISQGVPVCSCTLTAKRARSGSVRDPMPISLANLPRAIPETLRISPNNLTQHGYPGGGADTPGKSLVHSDGSAVWINQADAGRADCLCRPPGNGLDVMDELCYTEENNVTERTALSVSRRFPGPASEYCDGTEDSFCK